MVSISTVRRFALILGLGITMTSFIACGGEDTSVVAEGCDRFDECNALAAGVSADECVEVVETQLENIAPSARNDWETLMGGCLQFDTCGAFLTCVDSNDL